MPLTVWEEYLFSPSRSSKAATAAPSWPLSISCVAWSEYRPAVFFVLDSVGCLFSFDILKDDTGPVGFEASPLKNSSTRREGYSRQGLDHSEAEARENEAGAHDEICWAAPTLALSVDTLATGSRPRVAVSAGGKAFTRRFSRRLFHVVNRCASAAPGTPAGGLSPQGQENNDGDIEERERMKEWLRTMLGEG